jgi:hypothetical protein
MNDNFIKDNNIDNNLIDKRDIKFNNLLIFLFISNTWLNKDKYNELLINLDKILNDLGVNVKDKNMFKRNFKKDKNKK